MKRLPPNPTRLHGFSIVEALIALVVLSVGMLGIAALYVESLRSSRSALYRTQAVNLATDMANRIRANRNAGDLGDAYLLTADTRPGTRECAPEDAACRQAARALEDISVWLESIHEALPGDGNGTPRGTIAVDKNSRPTQYTITVTWAEPGAPQPLSYVLNLQV